MLNRYSSRLKRLEHAFLNEKLKNAKSYDRIAGFFSSSIFEVAGESIESITGQVRLIRKWRTDVKKALDLITVTGCTGGCLGTSCFE